MPKVTEAITLSRHLFHKISALIESFPPDLLAKRGSRILINKYNKTGYVLFAFM